MIARVLSEIPSLVRFYAFLTAVLAHLVLVGYLVYINMTCSNICLGAVVFTEIAKFVLLGLLLVAAVGLFLKRLLDAYYLLKYRHSTS